MERPRFKFEGLRVYQKSLDFVENVYNVTEQFPKYERFGLMSQFRRAAVSVSLNIAEGAGDTNAQFNRYLQIAQDSIKECVVCSTIATRQDYISEEIDDVNRKTLSEMAK